MHDDLVTGHHDQHGMAPDRLGEIGIDANVLETGKMLGQLARFVIVAAATVFGFAGREFQDQGRRALLVLHLLNRAVDRRDQPIRLATLNRQCDLDHPTSSTWRRLRIVSMGIAGKTDQCQRQRQPS